MSISSAIAASGDHADPRPEAVVFDLDGLMFNTESVFTLAGTELLRRCGKVPPPDLFHRMMGRRPVEGFQILIDVMDLSESFEVLAQESEEERLQSSLKI